MAYELDPDDPLDEAATEVVASQIDGALEDLGVVAAGDAPLPDVEAAVHDARKRAKKVRGVARLVRGAVGDDAYHAVNDRARDAARELSEVRDAQVLVEVVDDLLAWGRAHDEIDVDRRHHQAARLEVHRRATDAVSAPGLVGAAHRAAALFEQALDAAEHWDFDDDPEELAGGLGTTYRRGRVAWGEAGKVRTDAALHEWRKRVKYGWYHLRLLAPVAPQVLGDDARRFHELADLLGDDHDLAVLVGTVTGDEESWGGDDRSRQLVDLAGLRRYELQARAFDLGRQLYVDEPKARVRHLERLWAA